MEGVAMTNKSNKPKANTKKSKPSSKHCPSCGGKIVKRLKEQLNIANEMRKPGD